MDLADIASDVQEQRLNQQIADARKPKPVDVPADFDGIRCIDCGDPMEMLRRISNRVRCAECQEFFERDTKRRRIRGEE